MIQKYPLLDGLSSGKESDDGIVSKTPITVNYRNPEIDCRYPSLNDQTCIFFNFLLIRAIVQMSISGYFEKLNKIEML